MPENKLFFLAAAIATSAAAGIIFWLFSGQTSSQKIISPAGTKTVVQTPQPPKIEDQTFGQIRQPTENLPTISPQVAGAKISGKITLAILGDSMVDTLGADLKNLAGVLAQYYPKVEFDLLNYGVGATNLESGLARLTQGYFYRDQNIPPLLETNPDLVIVESFAYNHPSNNPAGLSSAHQFLQQIVDKIEAGGAQVVILATIAPNRATFAAGTEGINWDKNQRQVEAEAVIAFLENAIAFAQQANLPLIDVYSQSLDSTGNGQQIYINREDNIHPSPEGIELISDAIAKKIAEEKIVEKVLKSRPNSAQN